MSRAVIHKIMAKEILDSRGQPTVEAMVETAAGVFCASVPSGVSRGKYEAVSLPASEAVKNIEQVVAPALVGKVGRVQTLSKIDEILIGLDSTPDKSRLGANAMLAVSMACCRASAGNIPLYQYISQIYRGQPLRTFRKGCPRQFLPTPCFNVLEGGKHVHPSSHRGSAAVGGGNLSVQEFMVIPHAPHHFSRAKSGGGQANSFRENFQAGLKIFQTLGKILEKKFGKRGVATGDEGGFSPPVSKTEEALNLVMEAIKQFQLDKSCHGKKITVELGLDCAASELYAPNSSKHPYNFEGKKISAQQLLKFYQGLITEYPILFLEDPFSQDDWQSWQNFQKTFSKKPKKTERPSNFVRFGNGKFLIVADDLTATNPERLKRAHKQKACNAIILKPIQIGTITETLQAARLAKEAGFKIIVSHRAGETQDDFIADLAVGIAADFIKAGAPAQPERMAKYTRLLEIEKEEL